MHTNRDWVTFRELAAILDHSYFMGLIKGHPISVPEARTDFGEKYKYQFMINSKKQDDEEQKKEIEIHKYFMSEACGYDVGVDKAKEDWIKNYAEPWRSKKESPENNGFIFLEQEITNPNGLHYRPSYELSEKAKNLDCNIFVHRVPTEETEKNSRMHKYDFKIDSLPYIDLSHLVKSHPNGASKGQDELIELFALEGDILKFVLYGQEKDKAISEIKYISSKIYDRLKKPCNCN